MRLFYSKKTEVDASIIQIRWNWSGNLKSSYQYNFKVCLQQPLSSMSIYILFFSLEFISNISNLYVEILYD